MHKITSKVGFDKAVKQFSDLTGWRLLVYNIYTDEKGHQDMEFFLSDTEGVSCTGVVTHHINDASSEYSTLYKGIFDLYWSKVCVLMPHKEPFVFKPTKALQKRRSLR